MVPNKYANTPGNHKGEDKYLKLAPPDAHPASGLILWAGLLA